jgi:L-threonylcarbamoyladenylate synthase
MRIFKFDSIIKSLNDGQLVIYPTDTIYALGADIFNDVAVKRVFEIKKRPYNNPLPVAVSSIDEINEFAYLNEYGEILCKKFLPGPLTLILPKKNKITDVVTGGLSNVALRIPNHKIALKLLKNYGPLTVTSANIHNKKVQTSIEDILKQIGEKKITYFIDFGILDNPPSTIIDITGKKPDIIREGKISKAEIFDVICK